MFLPESAPKGSHMKVCSDLPAGGWLGRGGQLKMGENGRKMGENGLLDRAYLGGQPLYHRLMYKVPGSCTFGTTSPLRRKKLREYRGSTRRATL